MRQACVLESDDLATLKNGQPLLVTLPSGQDFTIMLDPTMRNGNGHHNATTRKRAPRPAAGALPRLNIRSRAFTEEDGRQIVRLWQQHSKPLDQPGAMSVREFAEAINVPHNRLTVFGIRSQGGLTGAALAAAKKMQQQGTATIPQPEKWPTFAMGRRLTADDIAALRDKWQAVGTRFTVPEFAERVGVDHRRLVYHGLRHGGKLAPPRPRVSGRRQWTPAKIAEVLAYRKTHTYTETADHFSLSNSVLSKWQRDAKKGAK